MTLEGMIEQDMTPLGVILFEPTRQVGLIRKEEKIRNIIDFY